MSWNYSGNPAHNTRDAIRFLIGDTIADEPLVQDEEIAYAYSTYGTNELAGAACLRSLAARFSREGSVSVGDVSKDGKDIAEKYKERADELDPGGVTSPSSAMVTPVFGGTGDDARDSSFYVGMDDIPGGPPDDIVQPDA